MDLTGIADNLELGEDGIYVARSASQIAYPEDGSSVCFEVEQDSFWFNHRNDVIAASVQRHSPGRRFYDIGGGNGFVAKRLQDSGVEVVLVEPSMEGARNAKARGVETVVCSTLSDAGFAPEKLDSVGCFDVVEHIPDDLAFLRELHGQLVPGGRLYLTVPAYGFLWSDEDDSAEHQRRYTVPDLRERLAAAGFRVVFDSYIFSLLPLPVFLLRSLPSRLGRARNHNDPAKYQKEHSANQGLASAAADRLWAWELARIARGKRLPFGGSCFVVAEKAGPASP